MNLSPMPFGVRGVRPVTYEKGNVWYEHLVSNAFRREGRSPLESRNGKCLDYF